MLNWLAQRGVLGTSSRSGAQVPGDRPRVRRREVVRPLRLESAAALASVKRECASPTIALVYSKRLEVMLDESSDGRRSNATGRHET